MLGTICTREQWLRVPDEPKLTWEEKYWEDQKEEAQEYIEEWVSSHFPDDESDWTDENWDAIMEMEEWIEKIRPAGLDADDIKYRIEVYFE